MQKLFRIQRHGNIEISFAAHQESGPWISLVGDCFFRHMYEDFSAGPLRINDCPFTLAFPRSRIDELMDAVENMLPTTTGLLVVHAGANNVASTKFPAHIAAAMLLDRCFHLLRLRPHIQEISICLLSPRTVDSQGVYSEQYINYYNEKVAIFNAEIVREVAKYPQFSTIDFQLEQKNLWNLLRETGFGVNVGGRQAMAQVLQAIIIWKRLVGDEIRNGEPPAFRVPVPDRLLNAPFGHQQNYTTGPPPCVAPGQRVDMHCAQGNNFQRPLLRPPPAWEGMPAFYSTQHPKATRGRLPLLPLPSNYQNEHLQGGFQNYLQDFTWNDAHRPLLEHPQSLSPLGSVSPPPFYPPAVESEPPLQRRPLLGVPSNILRAAHVKPWFTRGRETRRKPIHAPNSKQSRKTIRKPAFKKDFRMKLKIQRENLSQIPVFISEEQDSRVNAAAFF